MKRVGCRVLVDWACLPCVRGLGAAAACIVLRGATRLAQSLRVSGEAGLLHAGLGGLANKIIVRVSPTPWHCRDSAAYFLFWTADPFSCD